METLKQASDKLIEERKALEKEKEQFESLNQPELNSSRYYLSSVE